MKFALFLLAGATFISATSASQVHRPQSSSSTKSPGKYSLSNLPIVDVTTLETIRTMDIRSDKELARSNRYSNDSGLPPFYDSHTHRATYGIQYVSHLDSNPLPISTSDLVAIGTIATVATHVSSDKTTLYSTFLFNIDKIFKNNGLQSSTLITVERVGGIAKFPGGREVMLGEDGMGLPEPNTKYLLFLTYCKDTESFQIVTGYAITGKNVMALDRIGDGLDGQDISFVVQKMQADHH